MTDLLAFLVTDICHDQKLLRDTLWWPAVGHQLMPQLWHPIMPLHAAIEPLYTHHPPYHFTSQWVSHTASPPFISSITLLSSCSGCSDAPLPNHLAFLLAWGLSVPHSLNAYYFWFFNTASPLHCRPSNMSVTLQNPPFLSLELYGPP